MADKKPTPKSHKKKMTHEALKKGKEEKKSKNKTQTDQPLSVDRTPECDLELNDDNGSNLDLLSLSELTKVLNGLKANQKRYGGVAITDQDDPDAFDSDTDTLKGEKRDLASELLGVEKGGEDEDAEDNPGDEEENDPMSSDTSVNIRSQDAETDHDPTDTPISSDDKDDDIYNSIGVNDSGIRFLRKGNFSKQEVLFAESLVSGLNRFFKRAGFQHIVKLQEGGSKSQLFFRFHPDFIRDLKSFREEGEIEEMKQAIPAPVMEAFGKCDNPDDPGSDEKDELSTEFAVTVKVPTKDGKGFLEWSFGSLEDLETAQSGTDSAKAAKKILIHNCFLTLAELMGDVNNATIEITQQ